MKPLTILLTTLFLISARPAAAQVSFTNQVNLPIPDANPNGIQSEIYVGSLAGLVGNVSVSLTVSGGHNGDLFAYLSSESGGFVVLLNRIGKNSGNPFGYDDPGLNVTITDFAATDIHVFGGNSGISLSGTWRPDGRNVDPQLVLDTDDRTALFSSFENTNPNGSWHLFVADMAGGNESILVKWSITIDVIPEPSPLLLAFLGGALATIRWRRRRR